MTAAKPPDGRRALLPGLPVLLRDEEWLQLGADPRHSVVLAATEPVRRTLDSLRSGEGDQDADVLAALTAAGRLCDPTLIHHAAPAPGVRAAVAITHPAPAAAMLARSGASVQVVGHGSPARLARRLLESESLVSGRTRLGLLISVGEPDRSLLDPWVRDGVAHVVVRFAEGIATIGPFVVPGQGACLRCLDEHRAESDPRWPLLLRQLTEPDERADGLPEPADPALQTLAVAWAVRELTSYVEGRRPATWSATLRLPPDLADAESITWLRHPGCGCSWGSMPESPVLA